MSRFVSMEEQTASVTNASVGLQRDMTTVWSSLEPEAWPHGYPLGGAEYIRHRPIVAAVYIVVSAVASLGGTFGNLSILLIIASSKGMRNARSVFLVNLACADLLVTALATPFGIVGMALGKEYFDKQPALCDFLATVCLTACVTALFSIGGISFNRFFNICHPDLYPSVFNVRNNLVLCACFWLVGIVMSLPGLVGWTDNVYDHKYLECIWNRLHNLSYTIFFSTCVVAVPVTVISFSFVKIYLHVRASKRRVAPTVCDVTSSGDTKERRGAAKRQDASLRLARTLFFIFAVFVGCWSPYALLVVVDWHDRLAQEVHLFVLLLAHMHASLNPAIYAATNAHFKAGFSRILGPIVGCRGTDDSGSSSFTTAPVNTVFKTDLSQN